MHNNNNDCEDDGHKAEKALRTEVFQWSGQMLWTSERSDLAPDSHCWIIIPWHCIYITLSLRTFELLDSCRSIPPKPNFYCNTKEGKKKGRDKICLVGITFVRAGVRKVLQRRVWQVFLFNQKTTFPINFLSVWKKRDLKQINRTDARQAGNPNWFFNQFKAQID